MIKISKIELVEYGVDAAEVSRQNIPIPVASFSSMSEIKQVLSDVYKFGEWRQNGQIFVCNYVKNDVAFVLTATVKIIG